MNVVILTLQLIVSVNGHLQPAERRVEAFSTAGQCVDRVKEIKRNADTFTASNDHINVYIDWECEHG
jgi:hypothetical protein